MNLYPDPAAKNDKDATYFFIKDTATLNYLRSVPLFKDAIAKNIDKIQRNVQYSNTGAANLHSDFQSNDIDNIESDYLIYIGKTILSDGHPR